MSPQEQTSHQAEAPSKTRMRTSTQRDVPQILETNMTSNVGRQTTEQLAKQLGLNSQSIQKRFSQTGSYFGVRPIKLPNRRLLWPADAVEQLTRG